MILTTYKITYKCLSNKTTCPAEVEFHDENDGTEACVHVCDPYGNECFIPLSIYSQVEACMQEVINEHMGRAKQ